MILIRLHYNSVHREFELYTNIYTVDEFSLIPFLMPLRISNTPHFDIDEFFITLFFFSLQITKGFFMLPYMQHYDRELLGKLTFQKIKDIEGLGRQRYYVSFSSQINPEIGLFFILSKQYYNIYSDQETKQRRCIMVYRCCKNSKA